MKIIEITKYLEEIYPLEYQENYDNCGLLIGDAHAEVNGILICFDITLNTIQEAIECGCNLIISHHPLIFSGIKKINANSNKDKIITQAIKNDLAIYAVHTNIDNSKIGVNNYIAECLQLKNVKILRPFEDDLFKIVVFCPEDYAGTVRDAMFDAGCGKIGNYDSCSFNTNGLGTFKANEFANPFVGEKNEMHFENEIKIESIVPKIYLNKVINAIIKSHPYEEVAYDVYSLKNKNPNFGAGIIGNFNKPITLTYFLEMLKEKFKLSVIRHNSVRQNVEIQSVAYCGGSGSFLIPDAIKHKADILVTADLKYHDFFDYSNSLILADIGHFESEQFIQDILFDVLTKKIPKFAVLKTKLCSNPIYYF